MVRERYVTIGGSDSLAGGGIQADLATFTERGGQGLSVLTSVVTIFPDAFHIHPLETALVAEQLASIEGLDGIAGVKVGFVPNVDQMAVIGAWLAKLPTDLPIVVDPVMAFKETDQIEAKTLIAGFKKWLIPHATAITPNVTEAAWLLDQPLETLEAVEDAATTLATWGPETVVIKVGTRFDTTEAIDVVYTDGEVNQLREAGLPNTTINGAGCTFSAMLATAASVATAKHFVHAAIARGIPWQANATQGSVWQGGAREAGETGVE